MKKRTYIFPILSFAVLAASVLICAYVSYYSPSITQAVTIPHVYYSAMKVTRIDQTGNLYGQTAVYRVDGMSGEPKVVTTLPQETTSAAIEFQPTSLSYQVYPTISTSNFTYYPVTVTGEGKGIQKLNPSDGTANYKGQIFDRQQWVHPEGKYVTVAEVYCLDAPVEGPCGTSFRLQVQDLTTGEIKKYEANVFQKNDVGGRIKIAEQLSSTSAVFVVDSRQEVILNTVGKIDFSTGKISIIFPQSESTVPNNYQFIRLSDDKRTAILLQWNTDESVGSKAYVGLDLSTEKLSPLTKAFTTDTIEWPKNSPDIFYESIDSSHITKYNVATGQETIVATTTTLDQYLHPKRFTIQEELSSTGVFNGKLTVIDHLKKQQRVLYNQTQRSDAYTIDTSGSNSPARIGDIIYRFIGIDQ